MEIGGYIELDHYQLPMLHEEGLKLNCGRNALRYLIRARNIDVLWMPRFMCNSCDIVLKEENVKVKYYSIDTDFRPLNLYIDENEWLYIVNFYGQLSNTYLDILKRHFPNLIVDNAQAYFQSPLENVDTIYTCRKFFGVADGAILYTNTFLDEEFQQDESFDRMRFLLGRFERTASEFYSAYVENNHLFSHEPIKRMSKLTDNLLHAVDYEFVRKQRNINFSYCHEKFASINKLNLVNVDGPYMYPLYMENGTKIRKELQKEKVYIPMLWPNVIESNDRDTIESKLANNILPLPIDQRYTIDTMEYIVRAITKYI